MKFLSLILLLSVPAFSQLDSTFVDSTLGYLIKYPSFISINRTADYGGAKVWHDRKVIVFLDDDAEKLTDHPSFRSYAIDLAINSCAADGPDGSQWAEDIDSAMVHKNGYAVNYVELFLRLNESVYFADSNSNERTSKIVGPFFVIDLSTSQRRQSLFLDCRPHWPPTRIQTKACRSIVKNIRLIKP